MDGFAELGAPLFFSSAPVKHEDKCVLLPLHMKDGTMKLMKSPKKMMEAVLPT